MSAAALDRVLAILIGAQLLTGLLTLRAGSPPTAPLFVLHGILGGALLAAVALKVRRSMPRAVAGRRWRALSLSLVLLLVASTALAGGFAWVASGRLLSIGGWTVMTLHVWAALALVPIAALHLVPRRWRVLRPPPRRPGTPAIPRRVVLASAALAVAGAAGWLATNALDRLAGGIRRFTGSRWLPDGGIPPATTFFGEGVPLIDRATWRLAVRGAVERRLDLSFAELAGLGETTSEAVLDCTSGWAMRTTWQGVPLAAVLDAARLLDGTARVTIRSSNGWFAELPLAEARGALLATGVAGGPLPAANGAPCRLVAPDRRGLEWVKWVVEVEVA